jgi:hypothetical protein
MRRAKWHGGASISEGVNIAPQVSRPARKMFWCLTAPGMSFHCLFTEAKDVDQGPQLDAVMKTAMSA